MRIKDYFEDYLNHLRLEGYSPKTIQSHRRFLYGAVIHSPVANKKLGHLRLTDIAYLVESGKAHGEHGPRRAVIVFRRYLRFLQRRGFKLPIDYRDIQVPRVRYKERIYYTPEEITKIFNAVMEMKRATPFNKIRMRALLETLFASGMRISEALSLTRKQFEEIKRTQQTTIKGKGGDERIVFFSRRAVRWIERHLEQRTDNGSALFATRKGNPLTPNLLRENLKRYRKEWQFEKKIFFHAFRRSLATYLIEQGVNVKDVQTILGHKSERTTLRYYVVANRQRAKESYLRAVDNFTLDKGVGLV